MRSSVLSVPVLCSLLAMGCSSGPAGGPNVPGGGVGAGVFDTYPHDGATGINPASDVLVEFAAAMNPSTVQVTFTPQVSAFYPFWDGNFMELGRGLSIALAAGTHYSATISGKTQTGSSVSHTFSFTTATIASSTVAPTLASSAPANGALGVDPMSHVVLRFSEPMRFTTVAADPQLGAMTWNATGDVLDFAPPPGGFLRGSSPSTVIQGADLAWNYLSTTQLSFTIPEVVVPFQVLGMSPAPGSTGVPLTAQVALSFSRDMDPASTAAAISFSPSNTCTASSRWINPRMYRCSILTPGAGTPITVRVGTSAKDAAGNPLPAPWSATFTVASTSDTTAPTIVSSTPANGTTPVANGTPLVINFSKPMDRGSVEAHLRIAVTGHFQWNAANTQVTYVPTQVYSPGLTLQWTADSSEDLSGNTIYEFPAMHELRGIGLGQQNLTVRALQAVTLGTLGSRADALGMLLIGDDARNQGTDAFLSFDLSALPGAVTARAAVRQAYLILSRVGCEGSVANLGGTLLVEGIAAGSTIASADLSSPPVGVTYQVQNVCTGPDEIFVPVTEKIRADFSAVPTQGGMTHFRLRFAQATNGDNLPDRLVLNWRTLLEEPKLRVVYETY